jgi:hypothetical protein
MADRRAADSARHTLRKTKFLSSLSTYRPRVPNLGGMADPDGTLYEVNGDKLLIHYPSDGMLAPFSTMTINSDGSLQGGFGTLKRNSPRAAVI